MGRIGLSGVVQGWTRLLDSPIFTSVHEALAALNTTPSASGDLLVAINRLAADRDVRVANGRSVRFVAPGVSSKAFAEQYEVRVFERGEVVTRPDSWHDFFNALIWLSFPRTKACLNAHHYRELSANFGAALRGTARDVLTLFDEGGIIVAGTDPAVHSRLRRHEWKTLFWHGREELSRTTRFLVFGHAILEKAIAPFAGVTAKALALEMPEEFMSADARSQRARVDEAAASYFSQPEALESTRRLGPLPILGIPGWTPDNVRADYYDDTRQFRPWRAREAPQLPDQAG